jgi:hypothetical protein
VLKLPTSLHGCRRNGENAVKIRRHRLFEMVSFAPSYVARLLRGAYLAFVLNTSTRVSCWSSCRNRHLSLVVVVLRASCLRHRRVFPRTRRPVRSPPAFVVALCIPLGIECCTDGFNVRSSCVQDNSLVYLENRLAAMPRKSSSLS